MTVNIMDEKQRRAGDSRWVSASSLTGQKRKGRRWGQGARSRGREVGTALLRLSLRRALREPYLSVPQDSWW